MDGYVLVLLRKLREHIKPFFRREKVCLVGIVGDHDVKLVEKLASSLYEVQVAVCWRIECSWKYCGSHNKNYSNMFDGLEQVMYYLSMKLSKLAYKSFFCVVGFAFAGAALSCGSTNVAPAPLVEEAPAEPEVAPEPETPVAEPEPEPVVDDEYSRSVGDVAVDRDTFIDDKEQVLKIIAELDTVMRSKDYNSWLTYVDKESINYWMLRKNLQKAEKRLPVKGIKLRELKDYFNYVFLPARAGRTVSEIRYISDTYIKAVQVQGEGESEQVTVYYYFNKIDGRWMVHLPPIEN